MPRLGPGSVVAGRYEVLGVLGQGGMGVVYRALDRTRRVEVALKVVRTEVVEAVDVMRFWRESELVARLDRLGGIARVHAAGRHEGAPFYVMELVAGRDLQALLREDALDLRRLATIVESVARTLGACHAANVVHRDVKPGNVLVADDGRPRLLDFGLAKDVTRETRMTLTGELAGTPAFMAPEQIEGEAVDGRADVYALGAILYHGLAGRAPFQGAPLAIVEQKLSRDPPAPSTIRPRASPDLEAICLRAMARAPGDRYQTAEALADDLARWASGGPVSRADAPSRRSRRRVRLAVAAVALVTTIVAAVATAPAPGVESPPDALEAALELDREALRPHAFGLGRGAPPPAQELRSRLVALRDALPQLSGPRRSEAVATIARLAAYERHLSAAPGGEPREEGAPGRLLAALRLADEGRVVDAADLVARVAREKDSPPELPLVAERVVLAALEHAVSSERVHALLSVTQASRGAGPGLATVRAAALRGQPTITAWVAHITESLADDALATTLERLGALLAAGPAAGADDVRFLQAVWEGLEARAADAPLERRAAIDRAFCAMTAGALPPPRSLTRSLEAASDEFQFAGLPYWRLRSRTPSLVLAALRHGLHLAPGALWDLDAHQVDVTAPKGSQAAAFVRFVVVLERFAAESTSDLASKRRVAELAQGVVVAPLADLAPELRFQALAAVVSGAARVLSAGEGGAATLRQALACATELRSLLDVIELRPGDPTPQAAAQAELRVRCVAGGWGDAPTIAEWLAGDARRRAAVRPSFRPWVGPVLVHLADELIEPESDDDAGRPRRLDVVLRFVGEALHLRLEEPITWWARGLRLKALRKLDRLEEAEQSFAPHADEAWGYLFALEAVRIAARRRDRAAFLVRQARAIELQPTAREQLLRLETPPGQ